MVLDDHKRIGKRFVPPFLQLGPLEEASWIDRLLPELIWIGILNDRWGMAKGAEICAELAKAGQSVLEVTGRRAWLCRISSYGMFEEREQTQIKEALEAKGLDLQLADALAPLCVAYPTCPIAFLVPEAMSDADDAIAYMRASVEAHLNRWNDASTFIQVHAVYMAFVQGRMFVREGSALANFPAVEAYPRTEESRKIASSCRASVNMFFKPDDSDGDSSWAAYFWNRGLELEPCRLMGSDSDADES